MLPGPSRERRDGRLDPSAAQRAAKLPAIVGFSRYELLRVCPRATARSRHAHGGQGGLRQLAFVRPGAVHMPSDRQPVAVGDAHHLRTFADCGFPHRPPPFFAGTKLPSRRALDQVPAPSDDNFDAGMPVHKGETGARAAGEYAYRGTSQLPFRNCKFLNFGSPQ
jgi:hypothetical protein